MHWLRRVNEAGTTVSLTTHYLDEAENRCRQGESIDEGEIIENSHMSTALRKLKREVFVLSLRHPLNAAPKLAGFETSLIGDCELEVTIDSDNDLNTLFAHLNEMGIGIVSLRNKANRLEELFLGLVESKHNGGRAAAS